MNFLVVKIFFQKIAEFEIEGIIDVIEKEIGLGVNAPIVVTDERYPHIKYLRIHCSQDKKRQNIPKDLCLKSKEAEDYFAWLVKESESVYSQNPIDGWHTMLLSKRRKRIDWLLKDLAKKVAPGGKLSSIPIEDLDVILNYMYSYQDRGEIDEPRGYVFNGKNLIYSYEVLTKWRKSHPDFKETMHPSVTSITRRLINHPNATGELILAIGASVRENI